MFFHRLLSAALLPLGKVNSFHARMVYGLFCVYKPVCSLDQLARLSLLISGETLSIFISLGSYMNISKVSGWVRRRKNIIVYYELFVFVVPLDHPER